VKPPYLMCLEASTSRDKQKHIIDVDRELEADIRSEQPILN